MRSTKKHNSISPYLTLFTVTDNAESSAGEKNFTWFELVCRSGGMQWRAPVHCAYIYNLRYSTNYKGFFWLFCLFFITNQTLWSQISKKTQKQKTLYHNFCLFLIWEQSVWLVMYSVVSGKLNHLGPWPILSQSILLTSQKSA